MAAPDGQPHPSTCSLAMDEAVSPTSRSELGGILGATMKEAIAITRGFGKV